MSAPVLEGNDTNEKELIDMTDTATIPTLTTTDDAKAMMDQLAETHEWVSVFWDRGWGDSGQTAEISIIVDGNGQQPKAWLTPEVYKDLRGRNLIEPNSLKTYKARRIHDFKAPAPEPKTGPNAADIAERVIRGILADQAGTSIWASFYRGLDPDSSVPVTREEIVTTSGYDPGWHVRLMPGARDVVATAWGHPSILGPDRIGDATCVDYPTTDAGEVDEAELRTRLVAAIEAKVGELAEARSGESR